jgi:hypothetical protein
MPSNCVRDGARLRGVGPGAIALVRDFVAAGECARGVTPIQVRSQERFSTSGLSGHPLVLPLLIL